jgi:sulfatase maturation enzyme AslB (radical SAM superfamily)
VGEPLLAFPQVKEIVSFFDGEDISCRVTMMTNGAMITREIAGYLYANHVDIGVSLDGPPDIQNSQRPSKDGRD